ncbi:odorant receptor 82a-like [Colletes latitarsis]|uniref:odorant receptor 82a-like n=1 Tax=Colletes latitarsis TaxID=2605962 RepID=UPI0040375161
MYVFTITLFADIYLNIDNMSIATDDGCVFAGIVVVIFKIMNYQIYQKKIAELTSNALKCANDISEFSNIEHIRGIAKKYYIRNNVIFRGFSVLGFFLAIALLLFSPMETGLPIRAKYPVNTTISPWREIGIAVDTVTISVGLLAIVAMDAMTSLVCSLIIMQFDILYVNFENCKRRTTDIVSNERNYDDVGYAKKKADYDFVRRYKTCLRFHQRLVTMANDYNKTYSSSMFVQMLSSTSIICLTGFQAVVVGGQNSDIIKFGMYLSAALSQLLYICWIGNELSFSSSMLDRSQWLSDWHHEHLPDIMLLFSLATMFTRQSMQLKAGAFYILSLETFIAIIRRSYSIFTLLNNMHLEDL